MPLVKGEYTTLTWESATPHFRKDHPHMDTHTQEYCQKFAASSSALHSPSNSQQDLSAQLRGDTAAAQGTKADDQEESGWVVNRHRRGWIVCLLGPTAQLVRGGFAAGRPWQEMRHLAGTKRGLRRPLRHVGQATTAGGRQADTSSLPALRQLPAPRWGGPQVFCWAAPEQVLPFKWRVMHNNTQQTRKTGRQGAERWWWGKF